MKVILVEDGTVVRMANARVRSNARPGKNSRVDDEQFAQLEEQRLPEEGANSLSKNRRLI